MASAEIEATELGQAVGAVIGEQLGSVHKQIQTVQHTVVGLHRGFRELQKGLEAVARSQATGGVVRPSLLADIVVRAAVAHFVSAAAHIPLPEAAERRYPGNKRVAEASAWLNALERSVVSPASTTDPGWAGALSAPGQIGVIPELAAGSVYSQLSGHGRRVSLFGKGTSTVPRRSPTPSIGGAFVGERQALRVSRSSFSGVQLRPHKAGVISFFSREISDRSTPAIESVLRTAMAEDTGIEIDGVLLDDQPETSIRPAGLLNGVTPLTPSSDTGAAGMAADVRTLLSAVPALTDPVLIASQGTALLMGLLSPGIALPVISAGTVPDDVLVLIDAADFVSAEGDLPAFDTSLESTIHADDTAPVTDLLTGSPVVSLWQSDLVGLRLLADVSWVMARPGRVAVIEGISW